MAADAIKRLFIAVPALIVPRCAYGLMIKPAHCSSFSGAHRLLFSHDTHRLGGLSIVRRMIA